MYSLKLRTLSLNKIKKKYLVLSLALMYSMLMSADSVEAHGNHMGDQEVFRGSVSNLDIRVLAIPIVGNVHISIQISYPEGSKTIEEAKEKYRYVSQNKAERTEIARRGQLRTLKDHTVDNRCRLIDSVIQESLN